MRFQRPTEDVHPGHRGHIQVDEDDVELAAFEQFECLIAPARRRHIVAVDLEYARTPFA